ncbi:uncharacterized protein EI90DRAFT_3121605 [Cantharellus anzutake]|uniref:uncharacterized protein n=1 Tax=Cantharellus anzutake TaxID=1750568 RepID=UPI0019083481|nr:uncharacterized protein EI90DRAFT_3121605 [Cantharellus anzutake]KAF8334278.1 hypothetical protein EI90DRAFT_3121605 [Cantharellus anzutake]
MSRELKANDSAQMLRGLIYITLVMSIALTIRTLSTIHSRSFSVGALQHLDMRTSNITATPLSGAPDLILGSYNAIRAELGLKAAPTLTRCNIVSSAHSPREDKLGFSSRALIAPLLSSSSSSSKLPHHPAIIRVRKRSLLSLESSQAISTLSRRSTKLRFARGLSGTQTEPIEASSSSPVPHGETEKRVSLQNILSSFERAYRTAKAAEAKAGKKHSSVRRKKIAGMKLAVLGGSGSKRVIPARVPRAGRGKAGRND